MSQQNILLEDRLATRGTIIEESVKSEITHTQNGSDNG